MSLAILLVKISTEEEILNEVEMNDYYVNCT